MIYIIMYLVAIVIANVTVAVWGPQMVIVNAFVFIGLDLTSRDKLHERWHNKNLFAKMFVLILAGGLLSYIVNSSAGRIALASTISFLLAASIDSISYHLLFSKHKLVKINGSNVISAAVDSIAFPTIAFGSFLPMIVIGQFVAKVAGGFIWSMIFNLVDKTRNRAPIELQNEQ